MDPWTARAMTTAIDSNILIALWNEDDVLNTQARLALDAALSHGSLVIAAPVFAKLLAAPSRNEAFLDSFCRETGIRIDGTWAKPLGGWPVGRSNNMSPADGERMTPGRAVSSLIS